MIAKIVVCRYTDLNTIIEHIQVLISLIGLNKMMVNQLGEPILEENFGTWNMDELSHSELATLLAMLISRHKLKVVRTNATKHGATELHLLDDTYE